VTLTNVLVLATLIQRSLLLASFNLDYPLSLPLCVTFDFKHLFPEQMQSNMTAASQASSAFGTALNFNASPAVNFLQASHTQQQIPANFLNTVNTASLIQAQAPHTSQVKDTTFTKIFVGGLPYHTTDESLGQFFQKFGHIEEAVVINDRQTGKSRGYGFVTMETREAAEAAVLDPNPIIDGRKANVNLAYLGVKSRIVAPTGQSIEKAYFF